MDCTFNCTHHSIVLEPAARRLSVGEHRLDLTTAEYEILACLVRHGGTVVSRAALTLAAFGREFDPLDRAVDVHISHLRKKLGCCRSLIVTVRSIGYLLRALGIEQGTANEDPRTGDDRQQLPRPGGPNRCAGRLDGHVK